MKRHRILESTVISLLVVCGFAFLSLPRETSGAKSRPAARPAPALLQGGARGVVRSASGVLLEGIGVQLISERTARVSAGISCTDLSSVASIRD